MAKATILLNYLHIYFFIVQIEMHSALFENTPLYLPQNILDAVQSQCVVVFPQENLTSWNTEILLMVGTLVDVSFKNESSVIFGKIDADSFVWPNGQYLTFERDSKHSILVFKRMKKDRTCLLVPETQIATPSVVSYKLKTSDLPDLLDSLILFVNSHCLTFRNKHGQLNIAGIHREHILDNIFRLSKQNQNKSADPGPGHSETCSSERFVSDVSNRCESIDVSNHNIYVNDKAEFPKCDRIHAPTSTQFFHEFVLASKPVIITGATVGWSAFSKWTNQFLRENFGNSKVHIKMTSDGIYEGVEPKSLWEDKSGKEIPKTVLEKLPYPDLVVVRPASMELLFSEFLDLMENISQGIKRNISAYLEYSTIADYFPELQEDISEMSFFKNVLELKHLNIWLSDGNTLGKLHFDPFDNFLCQVSGVKELLLFEPHDNTRMYEAHIQEAKLSYDQHSHTFQRKTLLESTSMVMAPVDISNPDFKRFPKFSDLQPLNCTIEPGEVLYMPAFWWHEVQSRPNKTEHRNLAVNFWYEPFLTREFPCPECPLDVNPKYFHLL